MPNWAASEMSVVLPTENADKFEKLFITNDIKEQDRYFARCFLGNVERQENKHGLARLLIQFDAAWSLHSCMIDGYPQESNGNCPTLEEICKELKVKRLLAKSREPGIGFEESVSYDRGNGLMEESHDLFAEPAYDKLEDDETMEDKEVEAE